MEHLFITGCNNNNVATIKSLLEMDEYLGIIDKEIFIRGFIIACQEDNYKLVQLLLDRKYLYINDNQKHPINDTTFELKYVCDYDSIKTINLLKQIQLTQKNDFTFSYEECYLFLCKNNKFETLKNMDLTSISDDIYHQGVLEACLRQNTSVIKLLYNMRCNKFECFDTVCSTGNIVNMKIIISKEVNKDIITYESFKNACDSENYDMIKYILLEKPELIDDRINYRIMDNICKSGDVKILQLLIQKDINKFINLNFDDDKAFHYSIIFNHFDLTEYILKTSSLIDISSRNDAAYKWLILNNNTKLLKLILSYEHKINFYHKIEEINKSMCMFDVKTYGEYIIKLAIQNNDISLIKLLLENGLEFEKLELSKEEINFILEI
jgi:hypothetical protein